MAGRKTAHSPTRARASILRSFLRRHTPLPAAPPLPILRPIDCSISAANNSGLPLNLLPQGFANNINTGLSPLSDPNAPSSTPSIRTWSRPTPSSGTLGLEYQLPADTVLEVSYAGSRGLKLFAFYNGNQAIPDHGSHGSHGTATPRPQQ